MINNQSLLFSVCFYLYLFIFVCFLKLLLSINLSSNNVKPLLGTYWIDICASSCNINKVNKNIKKGVRNQYTMTETKWGIRKNFDK